MVKRLRPTEPCFEERKECSEAMILYFVVIGNLVSVRCCVRSWGQWYSKRMCTLYPPEV